MKYGNRLNWGGESSVVTAAVAEPPTLVDILTCFFFAFRRSSDRFGPTFFFFMFLHTGAVGLMLYKNEKDKAGGLVVRRRSHGLLGRHTPTDGF